MKFAIVNGAPTEPKPKVAGTCVNCGAEMVSKCGRVKVWHWAHKWNPPCDPWWESETEWHRAWKNLFPNDWQEVPSVDPQTGERHVADVKNPNGLVIELQNSPISVDERASRERFYKEMIWVVNGKRGELDERYFDMGRSGPIQTNPLAYRIEWFGHGRLLHNWAPLNANVYLDFGKEHLWRLVSFDPAKKVGVVGPVPKATFIEDCRSGTAIRVALLES
ncbi:competence protein CoiA [Sorangium sp. So ce1151]|uniref:competence protein CoiA n=1 Tax=Sorangium sp. So ce1151 TaxID=3133332 RepID=UPI003F643E40